MNAFVAFIVSLSMIIGVFGFVVVVVFWDEIRDRYCRPYVPLDEQLDQQPDQPPDEQLEITE